MTAALPTPHRGIRLAGGAAIPAAPSWGTHRPVTLHGRRIGSVNELAYGHHVPVCVHRECFRALPACGEYLQGKADLRLHWIQEHTPRAAA